MPYNLWKGGKEGNPNGELCIAEIYRAAQKLVMEENTQFSHITPFLGDMCRNTLYPGFKSYDKVDNILGPLAKFQKDWPMM